MPSSRFRTAQDTTRGTSAKAARKTETSARLGCEAVTIDHPDQPGALTEQRAKTAGSRGHGPGVNTEAVPEIRGRGTPETRRGAKRQRRTR
jgi:hypothetical protein